MISVKDLERILGWMQDAGLRSLSVSEGERKVALRLPEENPTPASSEPITVKARAMGTFLPAHPRHDAPAVRPGDVVSEGAIVGYLRSSGTLVPILAPRSGRVLEIIASPGALLGYGAPVLTIQAEG